MKTLVIQLGHQGRPPNPGSRGAPGEQEFTALIGQRAGMLNRDGWQVRTVIADPPRELYRGDAFFAVHADGSLDPNVRGASIGYQNREGQILAQAWNWNYVQEGYPGELWKPNNYTDDLHYYYGVREAIAAGNIRACIIECGTITNAVDKALMMGHPERVLRAIGRSLGMEFDDMDTTSLVQLADGTPGEKDGTVWPVHFLWSRTYRDLKLMAAQFAIVAGQVSSVESRILAGVRGIVEADANATMTPEQLQQLLTDIRAGLPESVTNEDIQDAMRTVLMHGTEGQ